MTQEGFKRKLTAILSADAEGYSRLMGDNEESTIRTLTGFIQTIVRTLAIKIETAERSRVMHKDTTNYLAYDYFIRGNGYLLYRTRSAVSKARQMFEKAIELDPQFASAYTALGWSYHLQVEYGWTEFIEQASQRAVSLARKALSLDENWTLALRCSAEGGSVVKTQKPV